jgi:hypothetical protein
VNMKLNLPTLPHCTKMEQSCVLFLSSRLCETLVRLAVRIGILWAIHRHGVMLPDGIVYEDD